MILLQVIIILFIIHGLYQLFKYQYVRKYFVKRKTYNPTKLKRIIIITPVLREEKNIESYLNALLNLEYLGGDFGVKIVTTEKEFSIPNNNKEKNTITILKDLLKEEKYKKINIEVIHYPYKDGVKRDQISYAFDCIEEKRGINFINETYFLFLDADSVIERDLLYNFSSEFEDGVNVYQQPLIWFKNFQAIKGKTMSSFSFLQTFFSISYEIPMFAGMFFPLRIKYFVGHGLCLKGDYIRKIGGFPSLIEDVRTGRVSSFLDEKVKVVPGFGNVEVAKTFSIYIKQVSTWFFGCGLFLEDFKIARKIKGNTRVYLKDLIKIIYGYFKALRWLNKGLIHLLSLILLLFIFNKVLLILVLISLVFNVYLPVLLVASDFKKYWNADSLYSRIRSIVMALIYAPFVYMFNFIGVYYGLYKIIRYKVKGEISLPKTER